ncbi:DNA polymerase III subunit beta [uncultured Desulfobacterium sp.]|uniref:Beta sliding clamp n=1 Tax=uncultured Desulfobacterium sp. TaxID=201089 RepID=A0A445MVW1_9BACT|nr:DNA polymerase III subunit beta [uncultured Desulfobacterium sp.]
MEVKIDREELYKCVSKVQSITERKSTMPILSTILLSVGPSAVHVSATDLELGFQQILPAEVIEEGSVTISARKLFEILKESKAPNIHIKEKENNWIFISDSVARFNLACLPADEYPVFAEPEGVSMVQIEGEILREMINKTVYSVTREDSGFKLSGVFVQKVDIDGNQVLRFVATDGHRLSMVDKAVEGLETLELGDGIMIPKKGMLELNKMGIEGGHIQIGFKANHCVAKRENSLLVVRLLETKFPDYQAVIPEHEEFVIDVDRISLLEAMRRMLILTNDRYRAVKIILEDDSMELVSTNPDLGDAQEKMDVSYNGERREVGFNPQYFIEMIQSMESDTVHLSFAERKRPTIIKGDADNGFLGLLMPMTI